MKCFIVFTSKLPEIIRKTDGPTYLWVNSGRHYFILRSTNQDIIIPEETYVSNENVTWKFLKQNYGNKVFQKFIFPQLQKICGNFGGVHHRQHNKAWLDINYDIDNYRVYSFLFFTVLWKLLTNPIKIKRHEVIPDQHQIA